MRELPPNAPQGLCPVCLLVEMGAETAAPLGDVMQHEVSVAIGPASSSVLAEIGERASGIPSKLLREEATDRKSQETVDPDSDERDPGGPHSEEHHSGGRAKRDRYQLFGEIARGGMGAVLKGRDTDLGRELAFKVFSNPTRTSPT